MEPAILGLVLDSSVLIAVERRKMTAAQTVEKRAEDYRGSADRLVLSDRAEVGHGIYRANTPEIRERRRRFLEELKATVPIYPVTQDTAEIIARVGGEQAAKGVNIPLADLMIGACALELGYAIGTSNARDFNRIPGLKLVSL